MASPIDPELFARTAPAWNCIADPAEGPHYIGTPDGSCAWCGMTKEEITDQRHEQTLAEQRRPESEAADRVADALVEHYRNSTVNPRREGNRMNMATASLASRVDLALQRAEQRVVEVGFKVASDDNDLPAGVAAPLAERLRRLADNANRIASILEGKETSTFLAYVRDDNGNDARTFEVQADRYRNAVRVALSSLTTSESIAYDDGAATVHVTGPIR